MERVKISKSATQLQLELEVIPLCLLAVGPLLLYDDTTEVELISKFVVLCNFGSYLTQEDKHERFAPFIMNDVNR